MFIDVHWCSLMFIDAVVNPPTLSGVWERPTTSTTSTLYITRIASRGEFEGGDPYGTLTPTQRAPMGAEGGRWALKAADRVGTLILVLEEAPRETLVFHRLTPTQRAPKAAEGCPTLALFSLKINENLWYFMKLCWKSMKINENQLKINEKHWKSLKFNANPWTSIEHDWKSWKSMKI